MTDSIKWLIMLVVLGVLCFFCLRMRGCTADAQIPSGVRENAVAALGEANVDTNGVELTMEGQEAVLSGTLVGTDADKERAIAAVMGAYGVTDVHADALNVASPAPPPPPPVAARYYDVVGFKDAEGAVRLTGEVPDESTRDYLVSMAGDRFGAANVTDELRIVSNDGPAIGNFRMVLDKGLTGLAPLMHGQFAIEEGALSFRGEVHEADQPTVAGAQSGMPDRYTAGPLGLIVSEAADACDERFKSLLDRTQIRFRVSSAVISPASRRLLSQLADVARDCPGTIKIEGHTDSRGDHDANMTLSQQRADAVRDALSGLEIGAERLGTEGFGPDRPIGNNATAQGRQQNRRIEMHIERN